MKLMRRSALQNLMRRAKVREMKKRGVPITKLKVAPHVALMTS